GSIAAIGGSPFGSGAGALGITIDPTGTLAYVANETAKTIAGYSINTGTGALAALTGFPLSTGSSPEAVTVDPEGRYLYAANVIAVNELTNFSITPSTGAVTRASSVGVGTFPLCVVIAPSGQFAYVAN